MKSTRLTDDPAYVSAVERFWRYAQWTTEDECWLWSGPTYPHGYGLVSIAGRSTMGAHRLSYELAHGPIPSGMFVLHNCDVFYAPTDITYRRCVNPTHLRLGTPKDNTRDMVEKGRAYCGDRHYRVALSEAEAIEVIRLRATEGLRGSQLAGRFQVHQRVIYSLLEGRTWRHLEPYREMLKGEPVKQWSWGHPSCRECGTIDRPHEGLGLCKDCYWTLIGKPRQKQRQDAARKIKEPLSERIGQAQSLLDSLNDDEVLSLCQIAWRGALKEQGIRLSNSKKDELLRQAKQAARGRK